MAIAALPVCSASFFSASMRTCSVKQGRGWPIVKYRDSVLRITQSMDHYFISRHRSDNPAADSLKLE